MRLPSWDRLMVISHYFFTDTFKWRTDQWVCFLVILLVRLWQALWREVFRSSGIFQVPHHHGFQHFLERKSRCSNYRRYIKRTTDDMLLCATFFSIRIGSFISFIYFQLASVVCTTVPTSFAIQSLVASLSSI